MLLITSRRSVSAEVGMVVFLWAFFFFFFWNAGFGGFKLLH